MGKGKGMNSEPLSVDWSHGALPAPSEVLPLPNVYIAGSDKAWNDQIQIIMRDVPKEWVRTVTVAETGWKIRVTWNPPEQGGLRSGDGSGTRLRSASHFQWAGQAPTGAS